MVFYNMWFQCRHVKFILDLLILFLFIPIFIHLILYALWEKMYWVEIFTILLQFLLKSQYTCRILNYTFGSSCGKTNFCCVNIYFYKHFKRDCKIIFHEEIYNLNLTNISLFLLYKCNVFFLSYAVHFFILNFLSI